MLNSLYVALEENVAVYTLQPLKRCGSGFSKSTSCRHCFASVHTWTLCRQREQLLNHCHLYTWRTCPLWPACISFFAPFPFNTHHTPSLSPSVYWHTASPVAQAAKAHLVGQTNFSYQVACKSTLIRTPQGAHTALLWRGWGVRSKCEAPPPALTLPSHSRLSEALGFGKQVEGSGMFVEPS